MQRCEMSAWTYPRHATSRPLARYVPYIFTREELAAFFRAVDRCPSDPRSPDRGVVLSLLFRILYGSGLRVSEALHLQRRDVDGDAGTLYIRHAKGHKERRIPLHPALMERMTHYLAASTTVSSAPLFPNGSGSPYAVQTVYGYFRRFLAEAGIDHGGRGQGPRLHDVRHSYSVHCLRQWVADGVDLSVALPYLSAYLGHTGLKSTQDYLRLTAELYPDIVTTVEQQFGQVIPGGDPQ